MIILGNKEILNGKLAVLLNSSQSKTPCGNDLWIQNTYRAVNDLVSSGHTIITSLGLLQWELPLYLVSAANGYQVIISPISDNVEGLTIFRQTIDDFQLDESKIVMVLVETDSKARSPKDNWQKRDEAALALAHRIFPASIRRDGRLQKMLARITDNNKVDYIFKVDYQKSGIRHSQYDIGLAKNEFHDWDYITHWTRTRHGPWPGETSFSFYRRLFESKHEYPNSAFNTLLNIAREKKIRSSSNKIREGRSVIGFSEASPQAILSLMRWCPRQVNWNFEPYGVAISRKSAENLGMRPAIYGNKETYAQLPEFDKPYFQNEGGTEVDWSREKEWRHLGDLNLENLKENEIAFVTWNKEQAIELELQSSLRVFSFTDANKS